MVKVPKININTDKIKELSKKLFQDKYEKILQDLIELENENPDDIRVKQKIAEIYYKKDMIGESIAKYKEIADYYEREDFIIKAIKACQNIMKIQPDFVEYNIKLASLYLKIGMTAEAANQYRIAINHYASHKEMDQTVTLSQELVKIDPSDSNRAKLAEIYQNAGLKDEAVEQYEILAKNSRKVKKYDQLLHYYELILPHKAENEGMLKDVCILHLRNKRPQRALKILEQYGRFDDPAFADLKNKAHQMLEVLRKKR